MAILIHALKFYSMPAEHTGDREILVVAFRMSSSWLARMSVVVDRSEWRRVIHAGRDVRESLARTLFPEFNEISYELRK